MINETKEEEKNMMQRIKERQEGTAKNRKNNKTLQKKDDKIRRLERSEVRRGKDGKENRNVKNWLKRKGEAAIRTKTP